MRVWTLVACAVVVAVLSSSAAEAVQNPPRVSLSTSGAVTGDAIQVRAVRVKGPVRVYLTLLESTPSVRSRFDPRLRFIAALGPSRTVRTFTVPPLEPGAYVLAYWCPGCLPKGKRVVVQRRPVLQVEKRPETVCPATAPNDDAPPKVPRSTWSFHGNGELAVLIPRMGPLTTNSLGGYKMFWVARPGLAGLFRASYRRLDPDSPWTRAETVTGTLSGFEGPSWASRMSFEPGCWHIEARVSDVSLGFVTEVVRGTG